MRVPSLLASVSTATSCCCGRERIARSLHKELTRGRCVNRRRHFDRAVTHLLAGGTGRAAYSAYRHQGAARRPSSSSAHGCSNKFVGTRNTRCGRVALKAAATAATPHSRRALGEARNRSAQHAGRRTTARKRPGVHQKTTQRGA